MNIKTLITVGVTLFLAACSANEAPGIQINTPQGPIKGVQSKAGIQNYKAIPFAAPPVGDLRWAPPADAPTWTEVRNASVFSPMCMQGTEDTGAFMNRMVDGHGISGPKNFLIKRAVASMGTNEVSEDCLYLNVRTPNIAADGTLKDAPLPVMVWIHGGGHQFGSADTSYYQSDALPQKGVVLVTINYRLGAFGYLAHPAISAADPRGVSGNYGTLDQIAALQWVQNNISAYGGDPNNVTIFGESAGSWSVTEMMASPLAKGLFHKAIGQSGASTYHLGQMEGEGVGWVSGYATATKLDTALGLSNPNAQDLRAIPAVDIVKAATSDIADGFHHVRDGVVFPDNVGVAFKNGTINAVPVIFGYNTDEGTLFFPNDPEPSVWVEGLPRKDKAAQIATLEPHFGETASELVDLYGLDENFDKGGMAMMGDEIFGVNVRYAARQNAKHGHASYLYSFGRIPPSKKQTLHAFHAAEIPFVFNSHEKILGLTKSDEDLTALMTDYWTNFAKTGNPNDKDLPSWPTHDGTHWMQFGGNNDLQTGAIKDHRDAKLNALEVGLIRKLEALEADLSPDAEIPVDTQMQE